MNQLDPTQYQITQLLCPFSVKLKHKIGQLESTANRIAEDFEPKSNGYFYYRIISSFDQEYRSVFYFESQRDWIDFNVLHKDMIINEGQD